MSLCAGQGAPVSRRSTAGKLMEDLLRETREVILQLGEEF